MAALQYVDIPGYSALLLRRTYPELAQPGGLIPRSLEWLAGKARWKETDFTWTFPSGAVLAFGYLQRKTDKYRYQSSEFDFIGFDELTHFDEDDYRYLFSRLRRRAGSRVPSRMRAASNPGGRGHRWVKRRFVEKKPNPDDPADTPQKCAQRIFIPALLDDNPGVDQAAYRRALSELDPETLAQLLEGDWNAREPGAWIFEGVDAAEQRGRDFDRLRELGELVDPDGEAMQLGIDWGDHTTACVIGWPLERGGIYIPPQEVVLHGPDAEPGRATDAMLVAADAYEWPVSEARYDSAGAQSMRTFATHSPESIGIWKVAFATRKDEAIGYLQQLFRRTAEGKDTRIIAISPRNDVLLDQLRGYHRDAVSGRIVKGDDHSVDALIALISPVAQRHRESLGT